MSSRDKVRDITSIVKEAENSISSIKNHDMRIIAFKEVLKYLLNITPTEISDAMIPKTTKKRKKKSSKPTKTTGTRKKLLGQGPMKRVMDLVEDGFFKKARTVNIDVIPELEQRGHHLEYRNLASTFQALVRKKVLRRKKAMKPGTKKKVWHYTNW